MMPWCACGLGDSRECEETKLVGRYFGGAVATTAACAAGVVTKTTDRDSLRYTYNGTRRVRQLGSGCESNLVKSTHDAYENTWKCGELKLYFSPSAGG